MKVLLLLAAVGLACCGCNTTQFSRTETWTDGAGVTRTNTVSVSNRRCIWTTESYAASLSGNSAKLTATKSSTDQQTIQVLAQALISLATKAP